MRLTKSELIALIMTGEYFAVMKNDDWNRDDIAIKREDGTPADIQNFPYRINQMPTYIFDELVRDGLLLEAGRDERGGTIFRINGTKLKAAAQAA
jgi:hypothetical protein